MVKPSIQQLTKGKFNRYILVIAAATSARYITNLCEKELENPDSALCDSTLVTKKELLEEKPIKIAINKIASGDIKLEETSLEKALNAGLNGIE